MFELWQANSICHEQANKVEKKKKNTKLEQRVRVRTKRKKRQRQRAKQPFPFDLKFSYLLHAIIIIVSVEWSRLRMGKILLLQSASWYYAHKYYLCLISCRFSLFPFLELASGIFMRAYIDFALWNRITSLSKNKQGNPKYRGCIVYHILVVVWRCSCLTFCPLYVFVCDFHFI